MMVDALIVFDIFSLFYQYFIDNFFVTTVFIDLLFIDRLVVLSLFCYLILFI